MCAEAPDKLPDLLDLGQNLEHCGELFGRGAVRLPAAKGSRFDFSVLRVADPENPPPLVPVNVCPWVFTAD
jgi:hypothetical protein